MSTNDAVNHPSHYTRHPSGIETIELTKCEGFCLGNAIKYLMRAGLKGEKKYVEDLQKAAWYIKSEIDRYENEGTIIGWRNEISSKQ